VAKTPPKSKSRKTLTQVLKPKRKHGKSLNPNFKPTLKQIEGRKKFSETMRKKRETEGYVSNRKGKHREYNLATGKMQDIKGKGTGNKQGLLNRIDAQLVGSSFDPRPFKEIIRKLTIRQIDTYYASPFKDTKFDKVFEYMDESGAGLYDADQERDFLLSNIHEQLINVVKSSNAHGIKSRVTEDDIHEAYKQTLKSIKPADNKPRTFKVPEGKK